MLIIELETKHEIFFKGKNGTFEIYVQKGNIKFNSRR